MLMFIIYLAIGFELVVIIGSYVLIIRECQRKTSFVTRNLKTEQIKRNLLQAPGPHPWPIIGSLDVVGRFDNTFKGFETLTKNYGDIYSLTLGHTRCLVVNNLELIKEVLNKNGKYFGGRPDYLRYHKLFGGDRNNSLALCDWSLLQQKRRNLARRHCSPRESSSYFTKMSLIGCNEIDKLMRKLSTVIKPGLAYDIKTLILKACANMFCQYMCSIRFDYEDVDFQQVVMFFDEIFWEINQGYPLDFLPWLLPFYGQHTKKICKWSSAIRKFILNRIVNQRELNIDLDMPDVDFTDVLFKNLVENNSVTRNTIIFMLEDFIGGHSAVGNLVMLSLSHIAKDPVIGCRLQCEVDFVSKNGQRNITLHDMDKMPYTMATIFEVLRYSSSPIVPHVATEDTQISGFGVTSGTIVFINNYVLNMGKKYWKNPEQFQPERFLEESAVLNLNNNRRCSENSDSGIEFEKEPMLCNFTGTLAKNKIKIDIESKKYQLKKNIPHFLPFSIGKRTCIGQNLVRGFGFILLANIIQNYNVYCADLSTIKIKPTSVALPADCFPLLLVPRL